MLYGTLILLCILFFNKLPLVNDVPFVRFPFSQVCSWSWVWCCTPLAGVQTRSSCTAVPTRLRTGPGSAPWAGPSTPPWAAPCSPSSALSSPHRPRSPPPATRSRRRLRKGKASSASSEAQILWSCWEKEKKKKNTCLLSFLIRLACEMEAPALFTTKTDCLSVAVLCLCGRNLQVPSFFSVFVFVFQQREVLCLLLYSCLTMWMPREALSVATCSVNKCDYIYFVHSYDDRRIIGQLDPGWADDVTLALIHWCFCHQTTAS